jgi:anti-sigma regulatory factor (Ser/Thr protein kinase)
MTPMAPTRPTIPASPPLPVGQPQCRIPLMADRAAAAAARRVVEDAIRAWRVPVDADAAVLLTSELVANAVTHGNQAAGTFVLLTVAREQACLRVDVHDGSADLPVIDEASDDSETGRGLLLVTSLSDEWGFYRTSGGKAVYFTLLFSCDATQSRDGEPPRAADRQPNAWERTDGTSPRAWPA